MQVSSIETLEAINSKIEQVLINNWCNKETSDRFKIKYYTIKNWKEKREVLKDGIVIYTIILEYTLTK